MGLLFEELDSQPSPLGEISLRRRRIPLLGDRDIYEVKLGDEFLMSSLFYDAEVALADLGLAALSKRSESGRTPKSDQWDVVVGGLGLGYTAVAALKHANVASMLVVEALQPVIDWHRQGLVPLGEDLSRDPRCRFIHSSFFELATGAGFDPEQPDRQFDAVLLDIDHSPRALLNPSNASFYSKEGLTAMAKQLRHGGVFALWSNELPDDNFVTLLEQVFARVKTHTVTFYNPFQNADAANTVYVAQEFHGVDL